MVARADITFDEDGALYQSLDAYLRGAATTMVRRESYQVANGAISRRIKTAATYAKNATERKYPNARARDPRRHPDPHLPHVADCWTYQLASGVGGAKLINTHPKAGMLLLGIEKPSTLVPRNFIDIRTGRPILMFPKGPAPAHLYARSAAMIPNPVKRPIPRSQRRVAVNESIGYRAIRNAFRSARRTA